MKVVSATEIVAGMLVPLWSLVRLKVMAVLSRLEANGEAKVVATRARTAANVAFILLVVGVGLGWIG